MNRTMIAIHIQQAIAKDIKDYLSSRRDQKEEELLKSKPQKSKGVVSKGIIIRLIDITKRLHVNKEVITEIEKAKKNKEQTNLEFQRQKYQALLDLLDSDVFDNELNELKTEYNQFILNLNEQYEPANWLDVWVDKAKDISFATHVSKLTHSSSKGTSILDKSESRDNCYLTTNSLIDVKIDTASSNAASLPIADILKISREGYSVLDCLKSGSTQLFGIFTSNKEQIERWTTALTQAYDSEIKQSYFLLKQVYFPNENGEYHLLLPLTSSSLAQELHLEQRRLFEEEHTVAKEQRKNSKYSPVPVVSYPNKARINITGSNHSNASAFNGSRGGKIILLSAQPPQWQDQPTHYRDKTTIFDRQLAFRLAPEISELKIYLQLLRNKELSDSAPVRRAVITRKFQDISSALFDIVLFTNQQERTNWTQESKLSIPYQLLFEPWRNDEVAEAEKLTNQWQDELCKDFAYWLNNQLNYKNKLNLSLVQSELWLKLFAQELSKFIAVQEVSL